MGLAICFGFFVLAMVLVGFPGPCSFSGIFGDALARTVVGGWIAYAIVVGLLLSVVWLIVAAIGRRIPS
jgi:hypothetical protein